jgi:hypothetical protein
MAHAWNPNYSRAPILKNPSQKRAGGVAQGAGPEFKLQYHQKPNQTKKTPSSVRGAQTAFAEKH